MMMIALPGCPGGQPAADAGLDTSASLDALPEACSGICNAATPSYPAVDSQGGTGDVTMYSTAASQGGACNYGVTTVMYYAAINVNVLPGDGLGQWQEGRGCGGCVEVTALTSQGPRTVIVRVMDRCADEHCGIDLGGTAPASIMTDGPGRYLGTWRFVSCAGHPEVSDGSPALFVNPGSNAFWSLVQVRNPPWPVRSIAWQDAANPSIGGSLTYAAPTSENYWQVTSEMLDTQRTYDLTVTYTDGSTASVRLTTTQLATPSASYDLP